MELGESDIHIIIDSLPIARVKGSFIKLREEKLSKEDTFKMTKEIQNIIYTSSKIGMQSMDQELVNLFIQGKISRESVISRCTGFEYTSRLVGGMNY